MKNKIILSTIILIMITYMVVIFKFTGSNSADSNYKAEASSSISNVSINDPIFPPSLKKNSTKAYINAKNYILMDVESAYPLIEKDSDIKVPIASTTKIMTAIVVLENYELDDIITISQNAASQIGSDVYLKTNEKVTVKNLLYALLIQSGNDAAMALSEKMGKDEFVKKMNEKAEYLGMKNTHYKDPAGLDDAGYSTAKDLATAFSYAFRKDDFKKIIKTAEATITSADGKIAHALKNSNRLIKNDEKLFYSESLGGKTGFTPEAGHCLVSAAIENNHLVVSVILNTYSTSVQASALESKKIIEWGFNNYNWN